MKSFLQAVGWWADTVLKVCWPEPEPLPSLDDLAAQQDDECGPTGTVKDGLVTGIQEGYWPESPDPVDHLIALVEDLRNLVASFAPAVSAGVAGDGPAPDSAIPPAPGVGPTKSSVVPDEGAAESPAPVEPPAGAGHPNLASPSTMVGFIGIGPECFAAADRSVLCWQGVNYVPQK